MNGKFIPVVGLLLVALASCGMRKTPLGNNITVVPKNARAYKNRVKFDSSVLKYIDTSVVYEEIGYMDVLNDSLLRHHDYNFYGIYRFYSNGFMNHFSMDSARPLTP